MATTTSTTAQEGTVSEAQRAAEQGVLAGGAGVARRQGNPAGWSAPTMAGQLLLPPSMAQPGAKRLVVLVPDGPVDEAGLAACIWRLASPRRLGVLLLGTLRRPDEQSRARRRLIEIAALTRADEVTVELALVPTLGWEQAVGGVWRAGDLIVCHSELKAAAGLGRRPLARALLQRLGAPVYVISGFCPELPDERLSVPLQLAAWIPPLAIIVAFFWLQAQLTQTTAGPLQTTVLICTVLIEFGVIVLWERWLSAWQ